jgi:ferredoxin-NADP reductase
MEAKKIQVKIFKSNVLEIENLNDSVKRIRFSVPEDFDFRAGQYLSLSVFDEKGRKIRRPLSIANSPQDKGFVEFCAKIIPGGLASEYMKKMKKGDEVELFGPVGKFTVNEEPEGIVFLAAGVGVAPFVSMIQDLLENGFNENILLLKSARTEKDSLYDKDFERISNNYGNFKFYNIFSKPKLKKENVGHVQDFLEKYIPQDFKGNFYICGLKDMIDSTGDKLIKLGFSEDQIFYEKFD